MYVFGADGVPEQLGNLHGLLGGGFWLERTSRRWSSLEDGEFPDNLFSDLPWFLDDYRPQGFLGRAFARKHAAALGQDVNPAGWSSRAVVEAMLRFGDDFAGAFVLGRESLRRALETRPPLVAQERREAEYVRLAERVLDGDLVGSSAGGEQPKFVIEQDGPAGRRHWIVKFSPPMDDAAGRRWGDLLCAEHIAGRVLGENGHAVARSEIVDADGRRFLEVERFDRTRDGGRVPVVSLRPLAAALLGTFARPWPESARALRASHWLDEAQAGELTSLWTFGRLVANTDMHDGNVSLMLSPERPARLAPVYDMLPMAYRPDAHSGRAPDLLESQLDIAKDMPWGRERAMAARVWSDLADSKLVSKGFRKIAAEHARVLGRV